MQFDDVACTEPKAYRKSQRAKDVEMQSTRKMDIVEPPMGEGLPIFVMAEVIAQQNVARCSRYRVPGAHSTFANFNLSDKTKQKVVEKRKGWYEMLCPDGIRFFWVELDHSARATLRQEAQQLRSPEVRHAMDEIEREDTSRVQNSLYQYRQVNAAASDADIYDHVRKDVLLMLD